MPPMYGESELLYSTPFCVLADYPPVAWQVNASDMHA